MEMNFGELILLGGPLMIPIIFCSILALGIIASKLIYFFSIRTDTQQLKLKLFELVKNNKIKEAVSLCDADPSAAAKILKAGLLKFGTTREEIKAAMEKASLFEIPKLEKRMTVLATIGNISPLLGLLGTFSGIARIFHTIETRAATLNPATSADLAGGIWEALLTTMIGLIIAIPTFVAYNYFVSQINTYTLEAERAATDFLNFLNHLQESSLAQKEEESSIEF